MNLRPALIALLLAAPPASADPLVPGQFAQGFAIDAPPGGAIYRLDLGEPVYRALQRADLGDLVVFNGSGEAVPQALEPAQEPQTPAMMEQPLPFYPLGGDTGPDTRSGLSVTVDAAGAVVSIAAPAAPADAPQTPSWIVDAGTNHVAALRGLRLQWASAPEHFARTITVFTSADLLDWRYLARATLAELEHDGHRLRQDTIAFESFASRFLRIDWGQDPVPLQAVIGRLADAQTPLPRNYSTLRGHAATAPESGWLFDAGGPLPVDRLRVRLPGENGLAQLRVWSRATSEARWIERGSALVYRLGVEGALVESPETTLPLTRERYWRLESASGDARALGETPDIELGWLPDSLVFLARGPGPYTLAAGSATGVAAAQPVAEMLNSVGEAGRDTLVARATLGEQHELGGPQALRAPEPPVPWQRYLMWALLVGGVVVLIRMALSLLRGGGS